MGVAPSKGHGQVIGAFNALGLGRDDRFAFYDCRVHYCTSCRQCQSPDEVDETTPMVLIRVRRQLPTLSCCHGMLACGDGIDP